MDQFVEYVEDIVIKNPQRCDVTYETKDVSCYEQGKITAVLCFAHMVDIRGYLNDGSEFLLRIPVDKKQTMKIYTGETLKHIQQDEEGGFLS